MEEVGKFSELTCTFNKLFKKFKLQVPFAGLGFKKKITKGSSNCFFRVFLSNLKYLLISKVLLEGNLKYFLLQIYQAQQQFLLGFETPLIWAVLMVMLFLFQ